MEDTLFNTPQKREDAVINFQSLLEHPGFQLLVKVVKVNIEVLNQQLTEGIDGETLDTVKEIRNKIKIHQNVINTPKQLIKDFTGSGDEEIDLDPYAKTLKESQE